jgi:hypothetical protein
MGFDEAGVLRPAAYLDSDIGNPANFRLSKQLNESILNTGTHLDCNRSLIIILLSPSNK